MFNKILFVLIFCLGTSSCSDNTQTNNVSEKVDDVAIIKSETTTEPNKIVSAEINSEAITFVKTTDSSPFTIDPNLFDSAAAKHFFNNR